MDLVAIDVHGKLTAGPAPAPAMPFPLLKMASISTKSLSTPDTGNTHFVSVLLKLP
jgi:hypothetical protein